MRSLLLSKSPLLRIADPCVVEKGAGRCRDSPARQHVPGYLRALKHFFVSTTAICAVIVVTRPALAQSPTGGSVVAGSAGISQLGNITDINQSSQRAIINWQGFSVGAQNTVNFYQPGASSVTLNRVIGNETSIINGAINANGQVFIVNSAGVLFGKGSQINVGGLVASTLDIANNDFMAGNYKFSGNSAASIVNQGRITAHGGGYVALLGKTVSNEGVIAARLGTVAMAAGNKITLNFGGDSLVDVTIDKGTLNALVSNRRAIIADGGTVIMTAKAADQVLSAQVNNSGVIQARTMASLKGGSSGSSSRGTVKLGKIKLVVDGGTVNVSGKLDASAPKGGDGGTIETSGNTVNVADGTIITTKAFSGQNGTWTIDPYNIIISSATDSNTANSAGTFTGSAEPSVINVNTLKAALEAGNVTISTTGAGTDAGDINVNASVSWLASTVLTLNATNNININASISATGASAGLVLNYGNYTVAGTVTAGTSYNINNSASVTLSGATATLSINGQVYTLIQSFSDFAADINGNVNASNLYALGQNLDASGTPYSSAVVGNPNTTGAFSGTLAGLGHTITSLTINDTSGNGNDGLIGSASAGSTVRDIGLVNANVTGSGTNIGALVGLNQGAISNAFVTGTGAQGAGSTVIGVTDVFGNESSSIGGLVGESAGVGSSIRFSFSNADVSGSLAVGGLVGLNQGTGAPPTTVDTSVTPNINSYNISSYTGGIIDDSYATGKVTNVETTSSMMYYGGLVGRNTGGVVSNSHASGDVILTNANGGPISDVGGLIGQNGSAGSATRLGTVINSYAEGNVTSPGTAPSSNPSNVGGLVGDNVSGYIENSHATGDVLVASGANVGGLVGFNHRFSVLGDFPLIDNSYATGNVIAIHSESVGGVAGENSGNGTATSISNSYYAAAKAPVEVDPLAAPGVFLNVAGDGAVGGLVGFNSGIIDGSHASGVIGGRDVVGGLVGQNAFGNTSFTSILQNSQFNGTVIGTNFGFGGGNIGAAIGGAVGDNSGIVSNVTVAGSVLVVGNTINSSVGGLIGFNEAAGQSVAGTVTNSRSTATVTSNDDSSTSSTIGSNQNTAPGAVNNVTGTGTVSTPTSRAQAAAAAEAAAARVEAAISAANATTTDAQTSSTTPPDPAMSKAGTSATQTATSEAIDDELKTVDDNAKTDDERKKHERQRTAQTGHRGNGESGRGLGATIRSIDVDGQRFNLQNDDKSKNDDKSNGGAPEEKPH
ncbi:MAG TPA: filamentous hemagglutinin N-terminal domain-containing protein [Afipia sp.]